MITEQEMYWLTRLDYLHAITLTSGVIILIVIGILGLLTAMYVFDSQSSLSRNERKWVISLVLISIVGFMFVIGSCFIPTTREMCAIKVVPLIVNNERVQQIPDKVLDLANEWLNEFKPGKIMGDKNENR